jgi:hypothetical protein
MSTYPKTLLTERLLDIRDLPESKIRGLQARHIILGVM